MCHNVVPINSWFFNPYFNSFFNSVSDFNQYQQMSHKTSFCLQLRFVWIVDQKIKQFGIQLFNRFRNSENLSPTCVLFKQINNGAEQSASGAPSSEFRVPSKEERKTDQRVASEFRVPSKEERKTDQRVASEGGIRVPSSE